MKFCIEVGEAEKHVVEFNFNQLLGQVVIKVNRKEIKRNVRLFDEPLKETHVIPIGDGEKHIVRIEKERKQLFGQKCRVSMTVVIAQSDHGTACRSTPSTVALSFLNADS